MMLTSLLRTTSTAASIRGFQMAAGHSDRQPARSLASTIREPDAVSEPMNSGGSESLKRSSSVRENSPISRSVEVFIRDGHGLPGSVGNPVNWPLLAGAIPFALGQ